MKDIKELAKELLEKDNIIIGYELEDGKLADGNRMVIIRPLENKYFREIWNHGKNYCSKMIIYLRHGDILIEVRPDFFNFRSKDNDMYSEDNNLLEELIKEHEKLKENYKDMDIDYNSANEARKKRLNNRIEWILDNLIDVVNVSKNTEKYNIIYKE